MYESSVISFSSNLKSFSSITISVFASELNLGSEVLKNIPFTSLQTTNCPFHFVCWAEQVSRFDGAPSFGIKFKSSYGVCLGMTSNFFFSTQQMSSTAYRQFENHLFLGYVSCQNINNSAVKYHSKPIRKVNENRKYILINSIEWVDEWDYYCRYRKCHQLYQMETILRLP